MLLFSLAQYGSRLLSQVAELCREGLLPWHPLKPVVAPFLHCSRHLDSLGVIFPCRSRRANISSGNPIDPTCDWKLASDDGSCSTWSRRASIENVSGITSFLPGTCVTLKWNFIDLNRKLSNLGLWMSSILSQSPKMARSGLWSRHTMRFLRPRTKNLHFFNPLIVATTVHSVGQRPGTEAGHWQCFCVSQKPTPDLDQSVASAVQWCLWTKIWHPWCSEE